MILYGQITSTQFLEVNKDPFCLKEENEELFGPKVPYLIAINVLMYLANCIKLDITCFVNLLARYSSAPTKRHWNKIKHILRLNIYCDTFVGQVTWVYIIQKNQNHN